MKSIFHRPENKEILHSDVLTTPYTLYQVKKYRKIARWRHVLNVGSFANVDTSAAFDKSQQFWDISNQN